MAERCDCGTPCCKPGHARDLDITDQQQHDVAPVMLQGCRCCEASRQDTAGYAEGLAPVAPRRPSSGFELTDALLCVACDWLFGEGSDCPRCGSRVLWPVARSINQREPPRHLRRAELPE